MLPAPCLCTLLARAGTHWPIRMDPHRGVFSPIEWFSGRRHLMRLCALYAPSRWTAFVPSGSTTPLLLHIFTHLVIPGLMTPFHWSWSTPPLHEGCPSLWPFKILWLWLIPMVGGWHTRGDPVLPMGTLHPFSPGTMPLVATLHLDCQSWQKVGILRLNALSGLVPYMAGIHRFGSPEA